MARKVTRDPLPAASGWVDMYETIPTLAVAYDGVIYGWVKMQPTGAFSVPHKGERPPKQTAAKLREWARERGYRPGAQVLRGRWAVKVTAEPAENGGGLHLEARRKLGPVVLDIFADAPGAAGPYRWGWAVERLRPTEERGRARRAIRQARGELAEGATWPDVVRVALREALAVEAQVCAADAVTRRGDSLTVASGLMTDELPGARPGAPVAATPAPVGQAATRRPGVRKGTQRALFS